MMKTVLGLFLLPLALLAAKPDTDQWFVYALKGKPCGFAHFTQEKSSDATAPAVLTQEMTALWRGQQVSLKLQSDHRQDDYLTPVKIVSTGTGDDEMKTYTATIKWDKAGPGKLVTKVNNRDIFIELPPHTLTYADVIEILPGLPFQEGFEFPFHSLQAEELYLKKNHALTYRSKEAVVINGAEQQLHHFEQTG